MTEQPQHPDSHRIEFTPKGDGVYVHTPCHGTRVFFTLGEAVPGARAHLVCPRCSVAWRLDLVGDGETECGVRPVWTGLEPGDG